MDPQIVPNRPSDAGPLPAPALPRDLYECCCEAEDALSAARRVTDDDPLVQERQRLELLEYAAEVLAIARGMQRNRLESMRKLRSRA